LRRDADPFIAASEVAAKSAAKGGVKPVEQPTLSQWVRRKGGFDPTDADLGSELDTVRGARSSGLLKEGGKTVDDLWQQAQTEGFPVPDNLGAFVTAVRDDASALQRLKKGQTKGHGLIYNLGRDFSEEIEKAYRAENVRAANEVTGDAEADARTVVHRPSDRGRERCP
jgi:hypothetical protein